MLKRISVLVAVLALGGCSALSSDTAQLQSTSPAWYPEYTVPAPDAEAVTQIQDITELTEVQKRAFHDWSSAVENRALTPAQRVDEFLQSSIWGFDFRGETFTASHAMQENAGNCLSLALLTAALAQEAGVNISFQEDMSNPIFKQKGSTMLMAKHVRAILRDREADLADQPHKKPKKIYIDYYSGKIHGDMVSKNALLAMFYRNKTAESLVKEANRLALFYADKAWQLDRRAADSINLMAVVLGRVGQPDAAGQFYRFAIENSYDNLMLRENYIAYLERHDRHDEARQIAASIDDAVDSNPYNWVWRAREALRNDDISLAKTLYLKAKDVAPYLVEPYHGLANVYVEKKQYNQAVDALNTALQKTWDDQEKQQYEDKLLVLTTLLNDR
ncbi:tetratricopeptide repeat protein [Alteromonas halophila]|uniref:Tetratricopeptide repeat protein n=1 Tax=Alteromonas halophila TaxID=516698 RepID=A0A918JKI4_9ALTE|nr:hypothetical protein [Alteromonas halophila]GGW83311.1 hypothetical protein GCM10007391_15910 [Alteromonas halophila]